MSPIPFQTMRSGVRSIIVTALMMQPFCYAQNPTDAPIEAEPAKSFEESGFWILFAEYDIDEAVKSKDFKRASELAQKYIAVAEANGLEDDEIRNMKAFLAGEVLVPNAEYLDAVHVLDDLLKSKPDPKFLLLRAAALHHAGWHDATLNELRRTLRLYPDEILLRGVFAAELLEFPAPNELDAYEALTALLPLKDRIAEEPRLAEAVALAAAASGDFELAVEMQKKYLGTDGPRDRELETQKLARYEAEQKPPMASMPAWDPTKLLSTEKISEVARKSMVMVRVTREFELEDKATGDSAGKTTIVHTHRGVVLSSMGTILCSSETVRAFRPDAGRPYWSKSSATTIEKSTINNTNRTLKEETIEIFSMPDDSRLSLVFGKAKIQGIDELSGLAVLEIEQEKRYRNLQDEELAPIVFQPEYRPFDPNTKLHLEQHFELSNGKLGLEPKPLLREVLMGKSETSAYHDWTIGEPTMARIRDASDSQSPIGTPIFNQLGECIGITHPVGFNEPNRTVVIPSAVCTRVAAMLMADGVVHRANLPIVVSGMLTNAETPSIGMLVHRVLSDEQIYQSLDSQWIIAVNGIPTPTLTEWLAVLERGYALGWKTMCLEVYDEKFAGGTACLEVPVKP